MDISLTTITTILQGLANIPAMIYLCNFKVKDVLKKPLFWITFAIYIAVASYIAANDNNWVGIGVTLNLIMYYFMLIINLRVPIKEAILSGTLGYIVVTLIESIELGIAMLLGIHYEWIDTVNIPTFIILALLIPLTYLTFKYIPILRFKNSLKASQYVITILVILSTFIVTIPILFTPKLSLAPRVATELVIIAAIIMITLLTLEEMSERNRSEQLRHYKTYLPIVEDMIKNIQVTQHSYNNQLLSLSGIIDSSTDLEQMRAALKELKKAPIKASSKGYQFLHLENKLLAGLLYQKANAAADAGFELNVTIRQYAFDSRLSNFDIIDVTGIIIDNALEHCEDKSVPIYITIGKTAKSKDNRYYIKVENAGPTVDSAYIHNIFKKGHTSKASKEGHGFGMYILKNKIEKCDGTVVISNSKRNNHRMISVEIEA